MKIMLLLFWHMRKLPSILHLKEAVRNTKITLIFTNPHLANLEQISYNVIRNISSTLNISASSQKIMSSNNNMKTGLGLIVFDLDYTLWPYHVDSTVSLPFYKKDSKIYDQSGKEINPFPEAPQVLSFLIEQGYKVAAASRTTKPPGALQLLEFLDWNKYFCLKEIYPGSKLSHFERFKNQTNLSYSSMLFFDDEDRNIREISALGVKCILVPNGINMNIVKEAIALFD